jgi:hypothetical protein
MNVGKMTIRNNEIRNNAPVPDPGSWIQDPGSVCERLNSLMIIKKQKQAGTVRAFKKGYRDYRAMAEGTAR